MKIREDPTAATNLVKAARLIQEEHNGRLDGLHVSDLIGCTVKGWRRINGEQEAPEEQTTSLIFLLGHALHVMLEHGQDEYRMTVEFEAGEGKAPGIVHASVDLLDFADRGDIPPEMLDAVATGVYDADLLSFRHPAELKTTKLSAKQVLSQRAPHYFEQLATYCLIYGTRFGRLYVLHIMGSYGKEPEPVLRAWNVEFEDAELAVWGAELERRYNLLVAQEMPALGEHYTMDCDFCPYHVDKGGECPGGDGERVLVFRESDRPKMKLRVAR